MDKVTYNGIDVYYEPHLDGGGSDFGQDYVSLLKYWRIEPVQKLFEWCAGPGFIGFSLLAHGLCKSLVLADINPEAVECCKKTIRENGLEDRVTVYLSDGLKDIPEAEHNSWDLVVGNPPHRNYPMTKGATPSLCNDPEWKVHKDFYNNISKFLTTDAFIFVQENRKWSKANTFLGDIMDGGLSFVWSSNWERYTSIWHKHIRLYFVGSVKREKLPRNTWRWDVSKWKKWIEEANTRIEEPLRDIGRRYGTDKAMSSRTKHYVKKVYPAHFSHIRLKPLTLFEIGIGFSKKKKGLPGASLKMWRDYFHLGQIVGIDINPECEIREERIQTFIGDQKDTEFLNEVIEHTGWPDIVIDDGAHTSEHILASFDFLWPKLSPNGYYVIEDLWSMHTRGGRESRLWGILSHLQKSTILLNPEIEEVHAYPHIVVMRKGRK